MTTVRFTSFPLTQPPPAFIEPIMAVFRANEPLFASKVVKEAHDSNGVLSVLGDGLVMLGFNMELSKYQAGKIERRLPPGMTMWARGRGGRAWMGNAVYRDLIQAMVMVQVDQLCLAVPNEYR